MTKEEKAKEKRRIYQQKYWKNYSKNTRAKRKATYEKNKDRINAIQKEKDAAEETEKVKKNWWMDELE